jgi:tetratricopeptide (TPR) repeat protein
LWLIVAESARRSSQISTTSQAWTNAINLHLSAYNSDEPLDIGFWLLADKTRPESQSWPAEVGNQLASQLASIGCVAESSEMVLWAAVAYSQYERGEFQSALVNYKKAETLVQGNNALWLRIAQAKCLAGMRQAPAAAAILSGPAACSDSSIAAAAMATMGSIKIQAGAYQQGAQLLHKALSQAQTANWPTRHEALADMAIAQLILGDTDAGLVALHESQKHFESSGQRGMLIQSLENELRLLEHEHRVDEIAVIKTRIAQLERW